jgi:hypothetical protein
MPGNAVLRPEQEHRSAAFGPTGTSTPGGGRWNSHADGEPCLDDLLNDPIMALLWQRDNLEPAVARDTVRALQVLVQGRYRGTMSLASPRPAGSCSRKIAAAMSA